MVAGGIDSDVAGNGHVPDYPATLRGGHEFSIHPQERDAAPVSFSDGGHRCVSLESANDELSGAALRRPLE